MRSLASRALVCAGLVFAGALPLGVTSSTAEASTSVAASLKHLVTLADTVVEATPVESKSLWEESPGGGKRIVTYTRVEVHSTVYGSPKQDLWVRTLGGVVDKIGQRVEGEAVLVKGERSMMFLHALADGPSVVVEMAQGHYPIREIEKVDRLTASPHAHVIRADASSAREVLHKKPLTDAVELIRSERKAVQK